MEDEPLAAIEVPKFPSRDHGRQRIAAVLASLGAAFVIVYACLEHVPQRARGGGLLIDTSSLITWQGPAFTLLHRGRAVLRGSGSHAEGRAGAARESCATVAVRPGGSLHISVASSGFWYGGPSMARALWPASLNTIIRQPWRSNDMLADRESLGSVLEGTWLTSTGVLLRELPGSRGAYSVALNQPGAAEGQLSITPSASQPVELELCGHENVRAAAHALLDRLPRPTLPQPPSLEMLRAPIWSTWARFKMDVDQSKVEAYANEIASRGFPRSHLEVDDRWSTKYGDLEFDPIKFPDAAGMIERLHGLGYTVTLWVVPFAALDSEAYAEGATLRHWLMDADGAPLRVTWWQGEGVALNVTDPHALAWFERRLRSLMRRTRVDGFKFDAGEAMFVPENVMEDPNEYCGHWARLAARFGGGGEVRCAHRSQDAGLWTREFDKDSRWSLQNGLRALVTSALQLGVLGYPFVLPDMVGGNAYSDEMTSSSDAGVALDSTEQPPVDDTRETRHTFSAGASAGGPTALVPPAGATAPSNASAQPASSLFYGTLPPRELYVRWCFANALLPAVQFSIAPWQYDEAASDACRRALLLRSARMAQLEALAHEAIATGFPIVRPLWWHDPTDPTCQWVDDEFMLGNTTLVAPVLDAAAHSRAIYLPAGNWLGRNQQVHAGPRWLVDYRVALDELATFELMD